MLKSSDLFGGGGGGLQLIEGWDFSALELNAVMQCEVQMYSGYTIGA